MPDTWHTGIPSNHAYRQADSRLGCALVALAVSLVTAHPAVQIEDARFVMGTHVISTQIILGKSIRVSSTPWSTHCRVRKALCIHTASTIHATNVRHSRKADASCWRFPTSCTSPGNIISNASSHRALKNDQSSNAVPPLVQEWFQKTEGQPKPWLAKAVWHNGPRCNPCWNRDCCKQSPPENGVLMGGVDTIWDRKPDGESSAVRCIAGCVVYCTPVNSTWIYCTALRILLGSAAPRCEFYLDLLHPL